MRQNTTQETSHSQSGAQDSQVQFLQQSLHDREAEAIEQQRVISKKLQSIVELQEQQTEHKLAITEAEKRLDVKRTEIATIQGKIQQVHAQIAARQNYPIYRREYEMRHNYYKNFYETIFTEVPAELSQLLTDSTRHIIVSPETLPRCQDRIHAVMSHCAKQGFLCIECVPLQAGEDFVLQEVAPNHYRVNMEGHLILALQDRQVTVLSTWVLQKAWYDHLANVTIWYDLSEGQSYLFGEDPEMSVEHWRRLEQAALITYLSEEQKELTYHRQDALSLPHNAGTKVHNTLFERLASIELTQEGSMAR